MTVIRSSFRLRFSPPTLCSAITVLSVALPTHSLPSLLPTAFIAPRTSKTACTGSATFPVPPPGLTPPQDNPRSQASSPPNQPPSQTPTSSSTRSRIFTLSGLDCSARSPIPSQSRRSSLTAPTPRPNGALSGLLMSWNLFATATISTKLPFAITGPNLMLARRISSSTDCPELQSQLILFACYPLTIPSLSSCTHPVF